MKKYLNLLYTLLVFLYAINSYAGMDEAHVALNKGDSATALQETQPLAEQGNAEAQRFLGTMYFDGKGVPQDYMQAEKWYRKAAEQGDAKAQFNLGLMYENELIVPQSQPLAGVINIFLGKQNGPDDSYARRSKNHEQAIVWYRKAAEQGYVYAQLNLGLMYGDKRDYTQAIEWYRRAAEQGEAISQVNLGLMYSSGQGVPQDYAQAVVWYRAAAEQGNATAQNNLGTLYYNGQGVPKDYAQALVWYRKAADQGNAGAKSNLSNLNFGQPAVSHQTQAEQVVTAQVSDPSIPGAIVCRDYDSVRLMIRLYRNSMEENLRASIIGAERERMLHGAPSSTPNLKRFGCVLLPSGTPMKWDGQWMPAIVTVKLSNGKTLRGVTDPSMIRVSKE